MKIYHTKVSLHENFQIYSIWHTIVRCEYSSNIWCQLEHLSYVYGLVSQRLSSALEKPQLGLGAFIPSTLLFSLQQNK